MRFTIFASTIVLSISSAVRGVSLPKRWNTSGSYLDQAGLTANNKAVFDIGMQVLDSNFGLPLLFKSPKLSSWYAVGLLARQADGDVDLANKLLANVVTLQYTDPGYVTYGSFKDPYDTIYADGDSLYPPSIYNSFDPNVNLFVTIAGIIIDSQFSSLLEDSVHANLRKAMYIATIGDGYRNGGINEDNLYPGYSNPWFMRIASATYVGNMCQDSNMSYWAEEWANQGVQLFDRYNTISEFNGGTYAGVTLFAMSLAQYCPKNSTFYSTSPRLLSAIWDQIAETYNPSLTTLSGPWDRTYGFDLTQYFGILGSAISGIIGVNGSYPMPKPLDGSNHYTDAAAVPMQMIVQPYMEVFISSQAKDKLAKLYEEHLFTAQAISPPWDKRPRNYTYWVAEGLSAGGVAFDESVVGGPSINQPSFSPGVILWDTGHNGDGAGFISKYYPTNPSCSIVAASSNLTISYPPSQDWPNGTVSNQIQLSISSVPGFQLTPESFSDNTASLPGLNVSISGNVVDYAQANRTLTYHKLNINGFLYYNLTYAWDDAFPGTPELVVQFTRTTPPSYDLFV